MLTSCLGHSPNYGRPKLAACGGHHQPSASVATIDCRLAADAALLADPHIITHIPRLSGRQLHSTTTITCRNNYLKHSVFFLVMVHLSESLL